MASNVKPLPGLVDPAELTGDRQFSINLARGLQVLRAFTPGDATLGNRALCDRTGLPKATVSRITHTLTMLGYLTRASDQRYALGAGVLSLGYPMLAAMRVRQIARPWLEKLAGETGCTVNLGLRERLNVVYVDSCRADRGNAWRPDIGSLLPLMSTSIGCAILAATAPLERNALLNRLRIDDPARFALDRSIWEREREAFAARGYCTALSEWRPDVNAIGVPLRQRLQAETMAVNCTFTSAGVRDPQQRARELSARLIQTVRRIEQACGAETPEQGVLNR
jgi:DNA-binding IclR family transcriptional regulator